MKKCRKHGIGRHSKRYDAFYCPECNRWLEARCPDPRLCSLCIDRPRWPSQAINEEENPKKK